MSSQSSTSTPETRGYIDYPLTVAIRDGPRNDGFSMGITSIGLIGLAAMLLVAGRSGKK